MLKRNITYKTFDDEEITETFYFNITTPELIELNASVDGGMGSFLEKIIKSKSDRDIIQQFKSIILFAYGQRSEDGKRFIKNDQLREEFYQSAAYAALFMQLAQNDNAAVEFITGIMPKDIAEQAAKSGDLEKAIKDAKTANAS